MPLDERPVRFIGTIPVYAVKDVTETTPWKHLEVGEYIGIPISSREEGLLIRSHMYSWASRAQCKFRTLIKDGVLTIARAK